jgi:hypothetical protein
MKATMLALVERSTGVLHAANICPRADRHTGAAVGAAGVTGVFAA